MRLPQMSSWPVSCTPVLFSNALGFIVSFFLPLTLALMLSFHTRLLGQFQFRVQFARFTVGPVGNRAQRHDFGDKLRQREFGPAGWRAQKMEIPDIPFDAVLYSWVAVVFALPMAFLVSLDTENRTVRRERDAEWKKLL
jgi:hypothetical protein